MVYIYTATVIDTEIGKTRYVRYGDVRYQIFEVHHFRSFEDSSQNSKIKLRETFFHGFAGFSAFRLRPFMHDLWERIPSPHYGLRISQA